MSSTHSRARWAAIGAAVAVAIGAGSVQLVNAAIDGAIDDGERTVLVPIDPCRLVDTRAGSRVGSTTTLQQDSAVVIDVHGAQGDCDIPASASGVSLNVTSVDPSSQTNLRIYPTPDDGSVPLTANLNPFPGLPQEFNSVVTNLDDSGRFSIYNRFGTVDVVVDVVGYYADHTHDDRYYTEDEINAAFPLVVYESSEADTTVSSEAVVLAIEVEAPSAGALFIESVATITGTADGTTASCSVSLSDEMDDPSTQTQSTDDGVADDISLMTVFEVAALEIVEINLVCEADNDVTVSNPQLMVSFNADLALATEEPDPTTTTTTTTTIGGS